MGTVKVVRTRLVPVPLPFSLWFSEVVITRIGSHGVADTRLQCGDVLRLGAVEQATRNVLSKWIAATVDMKALFCILGAVYRTLFDSYGHGNGPQQTIQPHIRKGYQAV